MTIDFEWDEEKDFFNTWKHGISFKEAEMVFFDSLAAVLYDFEHSSEEEARWKIYGLVNTTVVTVCFTERDEVIRLISARKATKAEEEEYFNGYGTT
jgi:uncharacterized DUF497 family protein